MSAVWGLLYIDTERSAEAVLGVVDETCLEQVDSLVYRERWRYGPMSVVPLDEHTLVERPSRAATEQIEQTGNPCLLVYPRHLGLVTVGLLHWFTPEQVMEATPAGRGERAARAAELRGREGFDIWANDTCLEALPQLAGRLSRELRADVAMLVFARNPAVETTALWFARDGKWVDYYFRSDIEGRTDTLHWAPRAADLFDGRFRFVTGVDAPPPDGDWAIAFHAEHIHEAAVGADWTTYDPARAQLYVPFWESSLTPVGALVYDLDAQTAPAAGPVAIRAVLPAPPTAIDPQAPERSARLLRLLTRNLPLGTAGLQFRDEASGEESIIFVAEVDWVSPRRIELDLREVEALLWPGRSKTLRVRIVDCGDARYEPLTAWSESFVRLGGPVDRG